MVKRSKDLVDYQNQIQVNSGFGFQTAINKSKEVQNQWATAIEKVSDGLMNTAKTIDESRAKGLAEEVQFEKDIKITMGEDGEEVSQVAYKPIEKSGLVFRASQDKYDEIVLRRFRADVMNTVNEASQKASNEVKQENGTIDQFDAMINNSIGNLISELPTKFSAYIQPEIDSTIQSYGNSVQTNRIRFENKKNDVEAKNFLDDEFDRIQSAINGGLLNKAEGHLAILENELPAFMENSEYATLNGQDVVKDAKNLINFAKVYNKYSGVGDIDNQNIPQLQAEINNIDNMLVLIDGGTGNLISPEGQKLKVTQAEFQQTLGELDASSRTGIRTMLVRKKALLSGKSDSFADTMLLKNNMRNVTTNSIAMPMNMNELDTIANNDPDKFLIVASDVIPNIPLNYAMGMNSTEAFKIPFAIAKTQHYLPRKIREDTIFKLKSDVNFTRKILPLLAELEDNVMYTENGIQVRNTFEQMGFNKQQTNALRILQARRTFGNQQISEGDIQDAFKFGADDISTTEKITLAGTSFKVSDIQDEILKTIKSKVGRVYFDDFASGAPLRKIQEYVINELKYEGDPTTDSVAPIVNRAINNAIGNGYVGYSAYGVSGEAGIQEDNIKNIEKRFVNNPVEKFYGLQNPFTNKVDVTYLHKSILETARKGYVNNESIIDIENKTQKKKFNIKDFGLISLANNNSLINNTTLPLYKLVLLDDDEILDITTEDGLEIIYDPNIEYVVMSNLLQNYSSINEVEQAKLIRNARLNRKSLSKKNAQAMLDEMIPEELNYKTQWKKRNVNQ